ncbi:MAG: leucyl/phenylalanyl-tRNA--protein transferase [Pseudomonadales bacterium]|nr:leucyl/phenylalanyl-tRNA--protein transferase [Pseudomonadales bacterium]
MPLPWLEPEDIGFPPVEQALKEPNGLLAAGGSLDQAWLLRAYSEGIFPWYETGQPILWWSPDPRLVLTPDTLNVSRSLKKLIKKHSFEVTFDTSFTEVIQHCAEARRGGAGTWITDDMQAAYVTLHEQGYAHSVEVWAGADLVGGLYGIALGKVFFGESMFSKEDNTSKLALVYLIRQISRWGFELIDCQVSSEHLFTLGAVEISRTEFLQRLNKLLKHEDKNGKWSLEADLMTSQYEH